MNTLPNELKSKILGECEYTDCMSFRATSRKNHDIGNYMLAKTQTFDFRHYRRHILEAEEKMKKKNGGNLNSAKMIAFMEFLPSLQKLVLADLPCFFTLSDMIKLGKSLPNLYKFSIVQEENNQWLGKEALLGLNYFESLNNLKLVGWEPSNVAKRGCAARYEVIPQGTLRKLLNITIICKQETVSKVLQHILDNEVFMTNCVKAKFNVRLSSADIPHLIMKFIEFHPNIQKIAFNGFLFTTQEQVQSFYDHLLALPQLERVHLDNCSVIERIEQALQRTFLEALRKRGIKFNNLVKSMRHG
ncbi:unnamed protein product [Caenorhabditis sp. 36 PRJEB53466]|nr:unnamed protein product [Caenorhabditis sp. 36 PRJEB53466]